MKFVVYYRVAGGTRVNRDYPDFTPTTDVKQEWVRLQGPLSNRKYLQHEPHDDYTAAFAPMVGKDADDQRDWLEERVRYLNAEAAKRQPTVLAPNGSYGGHKPGDIIRDQHGRSGRVPQVELEVFRAKPINSDAAMDAVRDFCKGGGGTIPKGS